MYNSVGVPEIETPNLGQNANKDPEMALVERVCIAVKYMPKTPAPAFLLPRASYRMTFASRICLDVPVRKKEDAACLGNWIGRPSSSV
jgi:hypothetical protein